MTTRPSHTNNLSGAQPFKAALNRPVLRHSAEQLVGLAADALLWLGAILVLGLANFALRFMPLSSHQMELMESIHVNTVYATMLVASAGAISRLLIAALDRLGRQE